MPPQVVAACIRAFENGSEIVGDYQGTRLVNTGSSVVLLEGSPRITVRKGTPDTVALTLAGFKHVDDLWIWKDR